MEGKSTVGFLLVFPPLLLTCIQFLLSLFALLSCFSSLCTLFILLCGTRNQFCLIPPNLCGLLSAPVCQKSITRLWHLIFPLMLNLLQITKEFSCKGAHLLLCKQQCPWRCLDPFPRSSRKTNDMSVLSRSICCKSSIYFLPSLTHEACLSACTCKFSWAPDSWVCRWEIQTRMVAGSVPGFHLSASRVMPMHSKKVLTSPCWRCIWCTAPGLWAWFYFDSVIKNITTG